VANISSLNDWIEAVSSLGQVNRSSFYKVGTAPEGAGFYYSYWKDPGVPPAGANPAAGSGTPGAGGEAYDLNNGGLWAWPDVEGSGKERYLGSLHVDTQRAGWIILFDRLVGVGGLAINSTGNKNCNTVALPRYTDGVGVEAWLEISTAGTANTGVISLNSYTNESSTSGRAGATMSLATTAPNIGSAYKFPLQGSDYGIKSVETINVATATTTAVANLVLAVRLAEIEISISYGQTINLLRQIGRFPRIYDGCTPWLVFYSQAGAAGEIGGMGTGGYR